MDESQGNPLPDSGVVGQPSGQPVEGAPVDDVASLKRELEDIKAQMRGLQSAGDKGQAALVKQIKEQREEFEQELASLKAMGFSNESIAEQRKQFEAQALETLRSGKPKAAQPAVRTDPEYASKMREVNVLIAKKIAAYDTPPVDADDPEYKDLERAMGKSPFEFNDAEFDKLMQAKAQRLGKWNPPGNADRAPAGVSGVPAGNIASLTEELNRIQAKAAPTAAEQKRRKEIIAEMMKVVPRK
jgi:hypothetical protein